ncbi:Cysteine proteinase 1, mitochondrial [Leucoagaricus sp. SymC.cos]|nr:Cysteine proteinase 1, mitochondrial [Leucoagaricus sp. SymC.cos]
MAACTQDKPSLHPEVDKEQAEFLAPTPMTHGSKAGHWEGLPKQFYEEFGTKPYSPSECFSLINDPQNEYYKLYTVDKLGNIWGGRSVLYVNTKIENMKNVIIKIIKTGQPVFFGCDVGQFSDSTTGIMDTGLFEYEVRIILSLSHDANGSMPGYYLFHTQLN